MMIFPFIYTFFTLMALFCRDRDQTASCALLSTVAALGPCFRPSFHSWLIVNAEPVSKACNKLSPTVLVVEVLQP